MIDKLTKNKSKEPMRLKNVQNPRNKNVRAKDVYSFELQKRPNQKIILELDQGEKRLLRKLVKEELNSYQSEVHK